MIIRFHPDIGNPQCSGKVVNQAGSGIEFKACPFRKAAVDIKASDVVPIPGIVLAVVKTVRLEVVITETAGFDARLQRPDILRFQVRAAGIPVGADC